MEKIFLLLALVTCSFLPNAWAQNTDPRWMMDCKDTNFNRYPATMYAIGTSVAVSVVVGYENAELVCSFNGPCVGIRFGSQELPAGTATLTRGPNGRVQGFSYKSAIGLYNFKCQ